MDGEISPPADRGKRGRTRTRRGPHDEKKRTRTGRGRGRLSQQVGPSHAGPGRVSSVTEGWCPQWRCGEWVRCRPVANPCGATFIHVTFWRRLRRCNHPSS
eukprot:gene23216-biopygen7268